MGDQLDDSGGIYRGHATILFSDLCASTLLGELLDPEILAEVLQRVRCTAEAVIDRHRGVLNQFYGDGILAVFGFPEPAEGDSRRAIEAALELHQTIATLPLDGLLPAGFCVRLHSGVHAGLVAIQQGDHLQGRYKVFGDALNTAARLASSADPDHIVASTQSLRDVLPYFITSELPTPILKGKSERIDACCVLGRSQVQTRFEARACRGLSPFQGRERELRLLERSLQAVRRGQLKIVSLVGDAGLGKTRLVEEFLRACDATHITVLRACCHGEGGLIPLLPFRQLLQKLFQLDHDMRDDEIEQHITHCIGTLISAMPPWQADLVALLQNVAPQKKPRDPAQLIAQLLRLLTANNPLVIFIDDWHCADEMSRQVISELQQTSRDHALFVIVTARTLGNMDPTSSGSIIELQPLPAPDCAAMVEQLLSRQMEIGIATQIHEQSGGNPLFIEELCQSLRSRTLRSNKAGSVLTPVAHDIASTTLHELIETRINRLASDALLLLRVAALTGPMFSLAFVQRVLERDITAADVEALLRVDLVHATDDADVFRFKHGVTHQVILGSIPLQLCQQLHARIAQLLEQDAAAGIHIHDETLAHHFRGANHRAKTIFYAGQAGDKALLTSSLDAARAHYALALSMLKGQITNTEDKALWISISKRWALASTFSPAVDQLDILQQSAIYAEELHDNAATADAQYWMSWINYALGDQHASITHCKKAFAIAKKLGDEKTTTQLMTTLGQSYAAACLYPQALALLSEAIAIKEQHRSARASAPVGSAYGKACKAFVLADMGEFDTAIMLIDDALAGLQGHNQAVESSILTLYAALLIWRGEWQRALELATQAQRIAERVNGPYVFAMSQAVQGYARWRLIHSTDALDALRQATQWMEQRGMCLYIGLAYGWLADALTTDGNFRDAKKYAFAAIHREQYGDHVGSAMAHRALATIAANNNDPDLNSPEFYFDKAMENAQMRNSAHEIALTQLHKGKWLLQRNDWRSSVQDQVEGERLCEQAQLALSDMGITSSP